MSDRSDANPDEVSAPDAATPPRPPTTEEVAAAVASGDGAAGAVADSTAPEGAGESDSPDSAPLDVETLVTTLETVTGERDDYLDALRRLQAEFENYRKAVAKRESDARERANESLVSELLPVLDACDGAVANGSEDVALIQAPLIEVLNKQGLVRLAEAGAHFDPELHEAVMHEDGDGDGPVVAEVLRVGYQWRGRTLRAAMVKVRG